MNTQLASGMARLCLLLAGIVWLPGGAGRADDSAAAVAALRIYLEQERPRRLPLAEQPFAAVPLAKHDAQEAARLLWDEHLRWIRAERAAEMEARSLAWGELRMPFHYQVFGQKPASGRSLFISLHGGGGAPRQVNDSQWRNQQRLYRPAEGVYLVPRAPTDTWNLWHQEHIDPLLGRLIENLIAFEQVDPDRIYLLGYSAGGDGVFQLAPRLADRFAAASMMAGHPNETSPLGLRNLPFSLHVGERDGAYNRNTLAAQWKDRLAELAQTDPGGYTHWAKIYDGKGHWLDLEDAAALAWMSKYARRRHPDRIVWKQDDVTHGRFYWLALDEPASVPRGEVEARRDGQRIDVPRCDFASLTLLLNDEFLDLDQPVRIYLRGEKLFDAVVPRTIHVLTRTLAERGDPGLMFAAEIRVAVGSQPADGGGAQPAP
ncbi:MAG: hypothetical protein J5I93_04250 [Pirellulaceae bacterium]|nr:hypothetical protein [Pirellulaceae bacterium]